MRGSRNANEATHRAAALCGDRVSISKVTHVGDIEVGGMPEGAAFTPDGKYLLVGNYLDQGVSILKVDGATITNTGKRFKLPGRTQRGFDPQRPWRAAPKASQRRQ
jgi:DNA-binding beta-propeller fold protein YncE